MKIATNRHTQFLFTLIIIMTIIGIITPVEMGGRSQQFYLKGELQQISETKWGFIFSRLAEMDIQSVGQISQVIENVEMVLEEFSEQLQHYQKELEQESKTYVLRTAQLKGDIEDLEIQVQNYHNKVNMIVNTEMGSIEHSLDHYEDQIERNKVQINNIQQAKEKQQQIFEQGVKDTNAALEYIDKIFDLLEQIYKEPQRDTIGFNQQKSQINQNTQALVDTKKIKDGILFKNYVTMLFNTNLEDQTTLMQIKKTLEEEKSVLMEKSQQMKGDLDRIFAEYDEEIDKFNQEINEFTQKEVVQTKSLYQKDESSQEYQQILNDKQQYLSQLKAQDVHNQEVFGKLQVVLEDNIEALNNSVAEAERVLKLLKDQALPDYLQTKQN